MKNVRFSTVVIPKCWIREYSVIGNALNVHIEYVQGYGVMNERRKYDFDSPEDAKAVFEELHKQMESK